MRIDDLDWDLARRVGLTPGEIEVLRFFTDIEGQVGFYYLELAKLPVARSRELSAFLTTWNYEEYFHADAITRLLRECGVESPEVTQRRTEIRARARLRARVEDLAQIVLSRVAPTWFVALWMTWGALQEGLTTKGYEELAATTRNPVLAQLCRRIAKQERRHFAFYFNQAHDRLTARAGSRWFCRLVVRARFAPVGSGVKTDAEIARLLTSLFAGAGVDALASSIDDRIAELPGLTDARPFARWARRTQIGVHNGTTAFHRGWPG